jgi:small subunit ribosomal protein S25
MCIHSHFLKEDMPRIRYANPKIDIQVNKLVKIKEETWQPELVLDFCSSPFTGNQYQTQTFPPLADGQKKSFNLSNKWSSTIFQELMDTAGGNSWTHWKTERAEAGLPIIDGPSEDHISIPPRPKTGAAAVLP